MVHKVTQEISVQYLEKQTFNFSFIIYITTIVKKYKKRTKDSTKGNKTQ